MQLKEIISSDLYRYTGNNKISIFSEKKDCMVGIIQKSGGK